MPERLPAQNLEPFQKIIEGVEGNLTKADCPTHGERVYFERVAGDIFQCANFEHKPVQDRALKPDKIPCRSLPM